MSNTEELRKQNQKKPLKALVGLDLHSTKVDAAIIAKQVERYENTDALVIARDIVQLFTAHKAASVQAARVDELRRFDKHMKVVKFNDFKDAKKFADYGKDRLAELQPKEGDKS